METCTAQVAGLWPKLCHLKDKRSNLIRSFKVIHVSVTKDFVRCERNKGNKETWGMEIEWNYSALNFSGAFRIMSNKLHAMWLLHCKQTDERKTRIFITSFFVHCFLFSFFPVFFPFLYCFFRYFVCIFPVVFFLLLPSVFLLSR